MKGTFTECDNCKERITTPRGMIGGMPSHASWITVTRGSSSSGDAVSAGEHNLCSEKCLREWLDRKSPNAKLSNPDEAK